MWALATRSRLPHISRTPVTPLTRNKGPNVGSSLDHAAWTCMSHKPGMRNLRSEEHTSELQSRLHLVCRLLLEKKKRLLATAGRTMPESERVLFAEASA